MNSPRPLSKPPRRMSPARREAAAQRRFARQAAREPMIPPPRAFHRGDWKPKIGSAPGSDPAVSPTAPADAPLAVIACHYNWAGFERPRQNLRRFLREMDRDGIPVYGVEMVLPDQTPVLSANPRWRVIEADPRRHILFQKEAALNLAATLVPAGVSCLAAVDADLRFVRRDWVELSLAALEQVPVIQPFREAVWTDREGGVELRREAAARRGLPADWSAHPGFAWVFRRDFFTKGPGLYPWCVTGAGDVVLATGLIGLDNTELPKGGILGIGKKNLDNGIASDWFRAAFDWMDGARPGWIEGQVWHEWHGSRQDRRYLERHRLMERVEVGRHLRLGKNGLVAWTSRATEAMRAAGLEHFRERKEDGR